MADKLLFTIKFKQYWLTIIFVVIILILTVWQRKQLLYERLNESIGCFGC